MYKTESYGLIFNILNLKATGHELCEAESRKRYCGDLYAQASGDTRSCDIIHGLKNYFNLFFIQVGYRDSILISPLLKVATQHMDSIE